MYAHAVLELGQWVFYGSLSTHVLYPKISATAVVPLSVHVAMLAVVMFFMGVALGGLNNGKQTAI